MLIASLDDGRMTMDVPGMKAYLIKYLIDTINNDKIIDAKKHDDNPIMKFLITKSGSPYLTAIEAVVNCMFDEDGATLAAYAVYKAVFNFEVEYIDGYYYFSRI